MQELLLALAVTAAFVLGLFVLKRLGRELDQSHLNRQNQRDWQDQQDRQT